MTKKEIWDLDICYQEYMIEVEYRRSIGDIDGIGVIEVNLKNEKIEGPNYHYWYFDDKNHKNSSSTFFKWLFNNKHKFLLIRWCWTNVYNSEDLWLLKPDFEYINEK